MDTIKKLSDYAIVTGFPTRFVGCPKTIDNDLALTDHTPGYGSAAKYMTFGQGDHTRQFLSGVQQRSCFHCGDHGTNAGWLTGAAALAQGGR